MLAETQGFDPDDSSQDLSNDSVDSVAILHLKKTARAVTLLDRDRISDEDLRDLNKYRASMIIRPRDLPTVASNDGEPSSPKSSSRASHSRRVTLYPVLLEARKTLIQTACLYEGKEYRPVYHRALADTAEAIIQRISSEGDYMKEVFEDPSKPFPLPTVLGSLQAFQTEIEEKLEHLREELED